MREDSSYITVVDENKRVVRMGGREEGDTHPCLGADLKEPVRQANSIEA